MPDALRRVRPGFPSRVVRRGAPLCLLAAVAVTDLVTSGRLSVLPAMATVPVLAAAVNGVGATVLLTGAAVGTTAALQLAQGRWNTSAGDGAALTMALVSLAGLVACWVRCRRDRRLRRTRSVAATVRRNALRPLPRRLGSVRLCATYVPARSEDSMGGDFYEALHSPYGVRVLVGDIRGKGPSAVAASVTLLRTFREAAHEERSLADVCTRLEACATQEIRSLYDRPFSERCATAVLVELPHDEPVLRMIHCGHAEPLTVRAGSVSVHHPPTPPGAPIGLAHLVGAAPVTQCVEFRPGDRLLLYTTGFVQARAHDGRYHDLTAHARARSAQPLEDMVRGLREDLLCHTGGRLSDDAALLALEEGTARA